MYAECRTVDAEDIVHLRKSEDEVRPAVSSRILATPVETNLTGGKVWKEQSVRIESDGIISNSRLAQVALPEVVRNLASVRSDAVCAALQHHCPSQLVGTVRVVYRHQPIIVTLNYIHNKNTEKKPS